MLLSYLQLSISIPTHENIPATFFSKETPLRITRFAFFLSPRKVNIFLRKVLKNNVHRINEMCYSIWKSAKTFHRSDELHFSSSIAIKYQRNRSNIVVRFICQCTIDIHCYIEHWIFFLFIKHFSWCDDILLTTQFCVVRFQNA